ncbi:MAG: hypothetical protein M1300_06315 [Epsilonproteobacteria bacterium]|nr:hypothetical protein [Campylobacterota bacterium]
MAAAVKYTQTEYCDNFAIIICFGDNIVLIHLYLDTQMPLDAGDGVDDDFTVTHGIPYVGVDVGL